MRKGHSITSSFTCPECDQGVCGLPSPALVISGGRLRPATDGEIAQQRGSGSLSRAPVRLPGSGKEGLAAFLSDDGAPGPGSAQGFLITCTCGHLFVDEFPAP